jgi:hypothetical protein
MKWFITIILITTSLYVYAYEAVAFNLLQKKASSISRAMGMGYSSVADIWHNDPLLAIENPAIPALHDGVAIGFTHDKYDTHAYSDSYYNSSIVTVGYKGIGITLPAYNSSHRFGTFFEYGYDQQLYEVRSSDSGYSRITSYGLAVNLLSLDFSGQDTDIDKKIDTNLAIGVHYNDLDDKWKTFDMYGGSYGGYNSKAHTIDAGIIASSKTKFLEMFALEGSLGYKRSNLESIEIEYPEQTDPIGVNNIFGAGASISLPIDEVVTKENSLNELSDNMMTGRLLIGCNVSNEIRELFSTGVEIGVLDMLFLRGGYYREYEQDNDVKGFTGGAGLRFNFRHLLTVEANYARFKDYGSDDEESWDFVLSFDAVKIYDGLTN